MSSESIAEERGGRRKIRRWSEVDMRAVAPFVALALLLVLGALSSDRFLTLGNLLNVLTQSAFVAIIAVGATFVITAGGLDLSVGSMVAFVASLVILFLNTGLIANPILFLMVAVMMSIVAGALCGFANGLIITKGRIEPFIATLGTMGVFRGLTTWLSQGGSISLNSTDLQTISRPVYFGNVLTIPVPIIIIFVVAGIGAFLLFRTGYGRHVAAVGSNEDVARYSGISVSRVRIITYVLQGLCVSIAVVLYVPRLGSTTAMTGIMWELQAITAVIIGGTALTGGVGRIWGSICGAFILEIVGNIMILSNYASEYLISAIQGAIIIIAMLVQRSLIRKS
ncbi:MAG TPA: ABC transporter permease [Acidocella sp.]|jgi:ribose transport system permease protein|uniref:ABC transporter permease n=1 Tax=Acidocella sp. TaxID=50710 RepID=UPI002CFD2C06|nr:ABC transporter permease [Acidocella sp.]HVE22294.1 ABC transporter permease [Acidocella sp.]